MEWMLVCTAYEERPEFSEHGAEHPSSATSIYYTIVEDEQGDRYVVKTEVSGGPGLAGLILIPGMLSAFTLYGLGLAVTAYTHRDAPPWKVALGTTFGVFLLAWPYLIMFSGPDLSVSPFLPIPLSFLGFLFLLLPPYLFSRRSH